MNKIGLILLLAIVYGCSLSKQNVTIEIETIPVAVNDMLANASSFIGKIEIIPLETNDSSLTQIGKKVIYNREMDMYALYTRDQIVFTFTGDGRFIANSKNMQGQGPQEYNMALDIKFNPDLKGVDLLDPYGLIYTYSPSFNLISKKKVKSEFVLNKFMALSPTYYVFTYPTLWAGEEVLFVNMDTKVTKNVRYSGTISLNSMDRECFHKVGNNFYFIPPGINYYFYRVDEQEMKLTPIMYLDFGDAEIKDEDLPGRAIEERVDSDKERKKLADEVDKRWNAVRESDYIYPLIKFFNDDYVYVYLVQGDKRPGNTFIFNRKSKESFLTKDKKPIMFPPCFAMVDNVLLSICEPEEVPVSVDTSLMSLENIDKMKQLKEDDNPVILKYYLK
ncbi:hypothetical protein GGR06_001002 [Bacteroides reticulotermitis]|uniref:6-bladed beta-propeller n=1 Tax=Bacteroides reticulotermitis TaxID=1133319 RepID=A0A840D3D1_9BACE|nr:6-bladed beta-propeller [Bacteroides reticulotermitis]MBB4043235.1 hypothetical protein [Bacteroides reticulotermitis]